MPVKKVITAILAHPVSSKAKIRALLRFFTWQIRIRIDPGPHLVDWIEGSRFYASAGEAGITGNIYNGLYEFEDMCFALHLLREDDVFFDVGANAGAYTILASKVAQAIVVAFEPVRQTFERLRKNVEVNGLTESVICTQACVGDRSCEVSMTTGSDAMNHVVNSSRQVSDAEDVPMVRLDDSTVGPPRLIKIDVEGYELKALMGASSFLDGSELLALIVEVNGSGERYGFSDAQLLNYLAEKGFHPFSYHPYERLVVESDPKGARRGNLIFIRDKEVVQSRLRAADPISVFDLSI